MMKLRPLPERSIHLTLKANMQKSALVGVLLMGGFLTGSAMASEAKDANSVPDANPVAAASRLKAADATSANGQYELFQRVMAQVRASYVRPVDDNELMKGAIQGMVSGLDPHSNYLDAKSYANSMTAIAGQFGGVGLVMEPDDGWLKVVSPKDGTPAAKAGIRSDDRISAIDGVPVDGTDFNEAIDKMRGPVGSTVTLTIQREGEKKPLNVSLVRAVLSVDAVTSRREGDIAYVRIPAFNERTGESVEKAVLDLKKQIGPGLKGYVLDLRNNPGGLVSQAVRVSDDFLDAGEIVSIRGRSAENIQRYTARAGDIADGKPIVVLINAGSASASEIVSGALKDNKRATILGMTSFGKGSVQTNIPLGAGLGALHLTTGRYFTPSGHSIQAQGILPDIRVAQGDETPASREADLRKHLTNADAPASQSDAPVITPAAGKTYDDFQLSYAEEVLHGSAAVAARVDRSVQ
jgi:carboxyl-terminal processing protease